MSKGNSYWSTARGKVGDIVVSTLRGQRIERAYQPNVLNPKTNNQMLQRAKFADCVKFYKHAINKFFQFAYEDKKQTESDYNAFMRHNTKASTYLLKSQVEGVFPAIGYRYMMSQGSMSEPTIVNYLSGRPALSLPSLAVAGEDVTIGELSAALIADYSLRAGDIVTCVRILSSVVSLTSTPSAVPSWLITQFVVDTTSDETLKSVNAAMGGAAATGMYLDSAARTSLAAYAVVFSRKVTGQSLKVSNSYLYLNQIGLDIYNASTAQSWISQVLNSWGATGNAPLEGAYLGNTTAESQSSSSTEAATITSASPDSVTSTGSKSITLAGTNLTSLSSGSFTVTGGVSVTSYSASSATAATVVINVSADGTLSYNGTAIVTATMSTSGGTGSENNGGFQG